MIYVNSRQNLIWKSSRNKDCVKKKENKIRIKNNVLWDSKKKTIHPHILNINYMVLLFIWELLTLATTTHSYLIESLAKNRKSSDGMNLMTQLLNHLILAIYQAKLMVEKKKYYIKLKIID